MVESPSVCWNLYPYVLTVRTCWLIKYNLYHLPSQHIENKGLQGKFMLPVDNGLAPS
jgi:hypothetical protein